MLVSNVTNKQSQDIYKHSDVVRQSAAQGKNLNGAFFIATFSFFTTVRPSFRLTTQKLKTSISHNAVKKFRQILTSTTRGGGFALLYPMTTLVFIIILPV